MSLKNLLTVPALGALLVSAAMAQTTTQAPQHHEILIMNDGSRDVITMPVSKDPQFEYWHVGRGRPIDDQTPAATVPGLRISAWRDGQTVKVKLTVLTGKWVYNVPPRQVEEHKLDTYSLKDSSPLVVEDGTRYGLPVLQFRLSQEVAECSGNPAAIKNRTTALKVEGFPAVRGWCYLSLRNVSSKGIAALGIGRQDGQHGGRSPEGAGGNPLTGAMVAPGQTYVYSTNVSAQSAEPVDATRDPLSINFVVFEDGTYEGDETKAMQFAGQRAGYYALLEKFTPVLRQMLADPAYAKHESQFADDLRVKAAGFPEFDAEASQKAEARLHPTDAYGFRTHMSEGMRWAKAVINRWIDEYSRTGNMDRKVSFRAYWESVLAQADAAVARWNMGSDQRSVAASKRIA